ncbi:Lrp/AsnC ligand binding domain-containing protein [Candidatus Woesearchaeota archaeon]|jgi:DNA-binding Lrp family transcriptional regulator|nr:Lrp/AsnC ligand binding domain-containing protein [Candidatus Woesearchaeota archaeon]
MIGFVLISLNHGDEQKVQAELQLLEQVTEVHILFGEWDLIAKVTVDGPEALSTFVMDAVRTIPEIKMSSTLIVAK